MKTGPELSVVIPTMGRTLLVGTVKSLVASKGFERTEVIVSGLIRDASVLREITELCARHPQIRHLPISFEVGDSSEKKNAGMRDSRADLVAFLDDDVVVAADWPERMIACFARPEVGLVSGPGLIPEGVGLMTRLAGVALSSAAAGYVSERYLKGQSSLRQIGWSRIIGCNMVYRKKVIQQIGAFDPAFWPGEEMLAAFKTEQLGHVLLFDSDAYVYHYPRQSLARFWKQIWGYGATRIRLVRAGTEFEPTTVVPGAWVLSLFVLGIGALFSKGFLILLILDLAAYALADLWITLTKVAETRRKIDLLVFFVVPVLHLSYGLAEWAELFRPNKDLSEKSPAVR
jgi:cellulose synthase/poly-beta-1,6-N-acetylglucosamine synthase-like glycosyltransferase